MLLTVRPFDIYTVAGLDVVHAEVHGHLVAFSHRG